MPDAMANLLSPPRGRAYPRPTATQGHRVWGRRRLRRPESVRDTALQSSDDALEARARKRFATTCVLIPTMGLCALPHS